MKSVLQFVTETYPAGVSKGIVEYYAARNVLPESFYVNGTTYYPKRDYYASFVNS